jgi:hypothetical protein
MSFTASNDHLLVAEVSILSCDFVGRSGGDPPTKSPLRILPEAFRALVQEQRCVHYAPERANEIVSG